MTISKDNTRTQLTISKELKKQLEQIAKEQNRSFNNLVITILQSYIGNSSMTKVTSVLAYATLIKIRTSHL